MLQQLVHHLVHFISEVVEVVQTKVLMLFHHMVLMVVLVVVVRGLPQILLQILEMD